MHGERCFSALRIHAVAPARWSAIALDTDWHEAFSYMHDGKRCNSAHLRVPISPRIDLCTDAAARLPCAGMRRGVCRRSARLTSPPAWPSVRWLSWTCCSHAQTCWSPRALERALLPSSCCTHTTSPCCSAPATRAHDARSPMRSTAQSPWSSRLACLATAQAAAGRTLAAQSAGVKTSLCAAHALTYVPRAAGQRRSSTVAFRSARFTCGEGEGHRKSEPTRFAAPRHAVSHAPMRCAGRVSSRAHHVRTSYHFRWCFEFAFVKIVHVCLDVCETNRNEANAPARAHDTYETQRAPLRPENRYTII